KPARDQGPASFWGLVIVVEDLEKVASTSGGRIGRIKEAVQPGRRIATVKTSARLGVPTAFMNPEVR
ncbi:MAG: glyoxalase, partial [Actinobacteria bacterium]|nr:glyoxalase [Actinomycetota bacterium]